MEYSKLSTWEQMMADYGFYHQQWFNLLTHFIGVPVIVTSVLIPLTWLGWQDMAVAGIVLPVNAGLAAVIALVAFYISLDRPLGWLSLPFLTAALFIATAVGQWGIGLSGGIAAIGFFGGFALQFIGHAAEGKKPALMAYNPIVAMITSPLFIVAEVAVKMGIQKEMFEKVARSVAEREAQQAAA